MAQQLDTLAELQRYVRGVVNRAGHHAHGVEDVLPYLLLEVIAYHDPGSVRCRTEGTDTKNVLWFSVRGTPYVLAYNHNGHVDLKDRNMRGTPRASFTNADSRQRVATEFARL